MQDEKGKWEFMEYENWDRTFSTLRTFIHHFSGASNVDMLVLHPEKSLISTGETTKLRLFELFKKVKGKKGPDHGWGKLAPDQDARYWSVNGIGNGDDQVGHLYDDKEFVLKENPSILTVRKLCTGPLISCLKKPCSHYDGNSNRIWGSECGRKIPKDSQLRC
jgi:hypothetical protein